MSSSTSTVTLLFTDIESSMQLWSVDPASMAASLEAHDRLMLTEIERSGGHVFTRAGDSFAAAFETAEDAVTAAERCQRQLKSTNWPGPTLTVRMGLHIGEAHTRDGDYFGPAVNLAARIADSGHGGQIVVSGDVIVASGERSSIELGSYRLKGSADVVDLHQVGDGEFAPLRVDPAIGQTLRFDGFELDLSARVLHADGEPVHLEPQVFDVLIHLVLNRDRLISREELLDEVWGDQFVSVSALTTRIKEARRALGDDGRAQRYIRNERGRGYQFVGAIDAAAGNGMAGATHAPQASEPDRVTIFGRTEDKATVEAMIASSSVTTIVGPGGVGKTTMVSSLLADWERRADSSPQRQAVMVQLDSVRDGSAVPTAVMTALGLSGLEGEPMVVACAEFLAATGQVLVLDNCEHVLDSVRSFVAELVDRSPSARVVTTSRQPLGLGSESLHRLLPLEVPSTLAGAEMSSLPCLQVFEAAARRAGGPHILGDTDRTEILELCRRLDGLPLAIELAASRLSTLGLRDLSRRLDDRLDWLRNRDVDSGERQRSLRSTVEWSFRFLDDECVRLVSVMAVFPAGLGLRDIDVLIERLGVAAPTDELVARLVDASVLVREVRSGEARYTMLETIRQFGLERLHDTAGLLDVARRHLLQHALDVSHEERQYWTGERDPRERSLERLHDELPNLRAARELMVARNDVAALVDLALGLCAFTEEACLAELWSWYEVGPVHDDDGEDAATRAGRWLLKATAARNRGDIEACREAAARSSELTEDPWTKGRAKHTEAMASLFRGDPFGAADLWIESDQYLGGCRGRLFAAMAAAFAGDIDLATRHLRACDITEDSAVPIDLFTNVHLVRGEVARVADTGTARVEFERAVEVARENGLLFSLGIAQVPLVAILEEEGETEAAAVGYQELIDLFLRSGTWTQIWTTMRNAARLLVAHAPATALLICAAASQDPSSPALDEVAEEEVAMLTQIVTGQLGEEAVGRIERRALLVARAEVVREVVAALDDVVSPH